jgi:hypothetical protein
MNEEGRMKKEELKSAATLRAGFVSSFFILPSTFSQP